VTPLPINMLPVADFRDYRLRLPMPPGGYPPGTCQNCGRPLTDAGNWNKVPKRYCDELCRKRAERNRWHARQKERFEKLNPGVSFTEWRNAH